MLSLDMFGFRALWSPFFLACLTYLTVIFFLITTKYNTRFRNSLPLERKQGVLFIMTIVLVYAIKGSPLDLLGHIMFSAHMTQMALLYLVVPPILIISIPNWLWSSIISTRIVKGIFSFFTKPLIALIVFNAFFSFYHIPLIFDAVKKDVFLHGSYTILLFIAAIFMWWPLVNSMHNKNELSGLKKVGYIFLSGVLLTPACALIIFAKDPMYSTFTDPSSWAQAMSLCVPASALSGLKISGPEAFNWLPLIQDQQLGGVLMKVIQEIVYGFLLGRIFFDWYKKENAETIDEIPSLNNELIKP